MTREHARALPIVAAWVAAAVVAVAVASWGVALVGRSVTDDRPDPLSAAQVEERLEQASTSAAPTSTALAPADESSTTTQPGPATSTTALDSTPSTTASTGSVPPTTTTSAPVTTAPPPAPAGETRTYTLVGGTASLRFEPTGVTVVFANPAPGFDVKVEPEHVNGVKVEFESETHESRVEGWWDGGPRDRTEERPED